MSNSLHREQFGFQDATEAAEHIGEQVDRAGLQMPRVSVTLGSGLKSFADRYTKPDTRVEIPTGTIPHFARPDAQASGHAGTLIVAPVEDGSMETMAIWAGRIHYYQKLLRRVQEEWERITDPEVRKAAVVFYIAVSKCLGVQDILTSNAVGSSRGIHKVGDIARVTDHMMDPDDDFGVPEESAWFAAKAADPDYDYLRDDFFYSQAKLYSNEMHNLAEEIAREQGFALQEGVLNWRRGRGYETVAYVRARTKLGASLFGMSTAPEAQKARSIGYRNSAGQEGHFAAFSLISNVAQLEPDQQLSHGEVGQAGASAEDRFNPFMHELVRQRALGAITSSK